jgi:hypothetical protein
MFFRIWFSRVVLRPLLCAVVTLCCHSAGWGIDFTEVARFNLDSTADNLNPEFIGNNPTAVGWNGSRLFVGGYNNSGGFANVAMVEVLSATSTGRIDTPTFGTPFESRFTPTSRGFISMDLSANGNSLVAAYDDGIGSPPTPAGYMMINTSDSSRRWGFDARGSSGATFDPGFGGVDSGAAFGAFGSGRRQLFDATTGAQIYSTTNGMIWYDGTTSGVNVRDMDFDPDTGDIYVRHSNRLSRATRTGGNSTTARSVLVAGTQADFVAHQNLSFLSNTSAGDLVIFNDRPVSSAGQEFLNVIKLVDTTGTSVAATFNFLDQDAPLTGAGWYDFDFDPVGQKLAILDSSNRKVYIFGVGGTPSVDGDFNNDLAWNCLDVNALVSTIASGSNDLAFDLTGDSLVNVLDLNEWLVEGGANNVPQTAGNPFLKGDANLDGVVDGSDFGIWNSNKFTSTAAWCLGDFNADGVVDGSDFGVWNSNKFRSSADGALVPEPATTWLLAVGMIIAMGRRATLA